MKNLFKFELLIIMFSAFYNVNGQNSVYLQEDRLPVSPTASGFSRNGTFNSELYTGNVSVSIPLLKITDGDLALPVSINAETGSIKVSEVPGWIGVGWSLSTGGVITRKTNDFPDDLYCFDNYSSTPRWVGYFYNMELNHIIDSCIYHGSALEYDITTQIAEGMLDMTPDEYIFNLPGYTGSFSFVLDSLVTMPRQNLKIEKSFNTIDNYIDEWTITTPDGIKYTFKALQGAIEQEFPILGRPCKGFVPSTWYLTRIEAQYEGGGAISILYNYYGKREIASYLDRSAQFECPSGGTEVDNLERYTTVPTRYISEITTSNDKVTFKASHVQRFQNIDHNPNQVDYKLDTLILSDLDGHIKKIWCFDYGESLNDDRFRLEQLKEMSYDKQICAIHKFDYYGTLGNLAFSSRSIDHWGFYNGQCNTTLIPQPLYENGKATTRDPSGSSILGALKRVTYPTGGYTEFEYEPHYYSFINNEEVSVHNVVYIEDTVLFISKADFTNNPDFELAYALSDSSLIEIRYRCSSEVPQTWDDNGCNCGDSYEPFEDIPLVLTRSYLTGPTVLSFTSKDLNTLISYYDTWGNTFVNYYIEIKVYRQIETTEIGLKGGGIRVKKITNFDGEKIETRSYRYVSPGNDMISNGVIGKKPVYEVDLSEFLQCPLANFRQGISYKDIGCTQGSYIGYSEVTELINDTLRTDYYFTTFADYPDLNEYEYLNFYPSEFASATRRDYLRGKLLRTDIFSNGDLIQSTINNYDYQLKKSCQIWTKYILRIEDLKDFERGYYYRGWFLEESLNLAGSVQTSFDHSGNSMLESRTLFNYTSLGDLRNKSVINSDGIENKTVLRYPYDYPDNALYNSWMSESFIYNHVISESFFRNDQFIEQYRNEFKSFKPFCSIRDCNLMGVIHTDTITYYDVWNGNLLLQYHKNGVYYSNIWQNGEYLIARFSNAKRSQVYFENFETSFYPGVVSNEQNARSGNKYLNSGTYTINDFAPESGRDYKLSYWYYKDGSGWQKVEKEYSPIITTDGSRIDDIIICPEESLSTTYTYDSLIGVTSQTDSNGITTFFEYDPLGRLRNILDNNHNILQHYEYNYSGSRK